MSDQSGNENVQEAVDKINSAVEKARSDIAENRGWFIALGVLLIVLGIVAIAFPFMTTIAAKIFIGWLFLIGGVGTIIHAFSTQKWSQFILNILVGILYLIAGGWLAFFPFTGILTLTLFLAFFFIAEGVLEFVMSLRMRPNKGWGWMMAAGIIAAAAGLLIIYELPSSAAWAIGLLTGINIISTGWAYLFIALGSGDKAEPAASAA